MNYYFISRGNIFYYPREDRGLYEDNRRLNIMYSDFVLEPRGDHIQLMKNRETGTLESFRSFSDFLNWYDDNDFTDLINYTPQLLREGMSVRDRLNAIVQGSRPSHLVFDEELISAALSQPPSLGYFIPSGRSSGLGSSILHGNLGDLESRLFSLLEIPESGFNTQDEPEEWEEEW